MPPESCRLSVAAQLISDRKSTRLNSSHLGISYAVFCLEKKNTHLNCSHLGIAYFHICLHSKIRVNNLGGSGCSYMMTCTALSYLEDEQVTIIRHIEYQ